MIHNGLQIQFRPMKITDLTQIMEIERHSFPTPWTRQAFYSELTSNQLAIYTVLVCDQLVVGYCGMWMVYDEAHITNFALLPDYRGQGLGEKLFLYVMNLALAKGARRMTLEVRVSNEPAQRLYQKLGFTIEGVRPQYYTDQEDALIMWVTLNESKEETSDSRN